MSVSLLFLAQFSLFCYHNFFPSVFISVNCSVFFKMLNGDFLKTASTDVLFQNSVNWSFILSNSVNWCLCLLRQRFPALFAASCVLWHNWHKALRFSGRLSLMSWFRCAMLRITRLPVTGCMLWFSTRQSGYAGDPSQRLPALFRIAGLISVSQFSGYCL